MVGCRYFVGSAPQSAYSHRDEWIFNKWKLEAIQDPKNCGRKACQEVKNPFRFDQWDACQPTVPPKTPNRTSLRIYLRRNLIGPVNPIPSLVDPMVPSRKVPLQPMGDWNALTPTLPSDLQLPSDLKIHPSLPPAVWVGFTFSLPRRC